MTMEKLRAKNRDVVEMLRKKAAASGNLKDMVQYTSARDVLAPFNEWFHMAFADAPEETINEAVAIVHYVLISCLGTLVVNGMKREEAAAAIADTVMHNFKRSAERDDFFVGDEVSFAPNNDRGNQARDDGDD